MVKNKLFKFAAVMLLGCMAQGMHAQDDLLAGKDIYPLGGAMTWTSGDASYTFIENDLQKLVATPTNTSNVFLYPENGTLNTQENQEKGAQPFYIDMGSVQSVGSVFTTWEGAAADSYNIFLTDEVPTLTTLTTTPTYSVSGLGQYTANTAILPDGSKGRYLVFQVTKATNWGWGVKIRSISASAPVDDVLTTFTVSPAIALLNVETPMTLTMKNQLGLDIDAELVDIEVSDNATYSGGNLIISSGDKATFTAKMNDVTLTADVYVATAPTPPAPSDIKTPIYTNTIQDKNSTAEFVTDWNGGATKMGEFTFGDGQVAQGFLNSRCIFFSNSETTGAWNGNIDPAANGYRSLNLDVFSTKDTECTIEFESVENLAGGHTYPFTLTGGEWTSITVDVNGATKLGNLSIRFTEANMADILLSNIYFTPTFIEGDNEAPVLGEITATPSMMSVEFTLTATDNLNPNVYYTITDGVNTYSTSGASGETVTYTVTGLQAATTYNFTITANDGKNVSDPKNIEVTTEGMMEDSESPSETELNNAAVIFSSYGYAEIPAFDAWGSQGTMSVVKTSGGNEVLMFSNYNGQWGGLVNLDVDVEENNALNIDIYGFEAGTLLIAPVWQDATGDTPNTEVKIEADKWNTYKLPLKTFGYPDHGTTVIQLALTGSTVDSFAIDNIYFYKDSELSSSSIQIGTEKGKVDVYNLQGVRIRKSVDRANSLNGLPSGIYIVDGKKMIVKN